MWNASPGREVEMSLQRRLKSNGILSRLWDFSSTGFVALSSLAIFFVAWVNFEFGPTGWEQIRFLLKAPQSTLEAATGSQILGFILQVIVPGCILTAMWVYFWRILRARRKRNSLALESVALATVATVAALVLVLGFQRPEGPVVFSERTLLESLYVEPRFSPSSGGEELNLVWIYVESMEATYNQEEIFGRNLISDLEEVTSDWIEIPRLSQTPGAGWTIGGLVASHCGLPLVPPSGGGIPVLSTIGRNDLGVFEEFLPGATCLGDVLAETGYRNVYLGGASPDFAGKGNFLSQHGFSTVLGKEDWEALGDQRMSSWGLHDDALFEYGRATLSELRAQDDPFAMMMLTLDTHHPSGHLNTTCANQGATGLADHIECSSELVADFIRHLEEVGALDDTVVVVTGDHLAIRNDLWDSLEDASERHIFGRIYVPGGQELSSRGPVFLFDLFPTVLSSMGINSESGGAAIGRNLFSNPSLAEDLTESESLTLTVGSPFIDSLWQQGLEQFTYELGQSIEFAIGGNAGSFLIEGLSGFEETHTWIEGTQARILLPLNESPKESVNLAISGWPFAWPQSPQNNLEILVNGTSIGRFPLDASTVISATIPTEVAATIGALGYPSLDLELVFDFAKAPCEVSESADCRELSFALREITARENAVGSG